MADHSEEIARINAILATGRTKTVDQDGRMHEVDIPGLEKQRDYLLKQQQGGFRSQVRRGIYNPAFRGW